MELPSDHSVRSFYERAGMYVQKRHSLTMLTLLFLCLGRAPGSYEVPKGCWLQKQTNGDDCEQGVGSSCTRLESQHQAGGLGV